MYGNCEVCGALYGTKDGQNFFKPCEHLVNRKMKEKTLFLVGFFKFAKKGPEHGFERMHLHGIFETEQEAREQMSFCDEAGWYEGALIEERPLGHQHCVRKRHKRVWLLQEPEEVSHQSGQCNQVMREIPEPEYYKGIVNLIG
jgi:hypothetical protein